MASVICTVADGVLQDAEGTVIGRLLAVEIELAPLARARGGERGVGLTSTTTSKTKENVQKSERPLTEAQRDLVAVQEVWEHYLTLIPSKRKLDAKRKRIILNAIKLVGVDATKLAVTGLACSPHHNGVNEQRRAYLEIRYALKGIGNESDDERIEKAISWAAIHSPAAVDVDRAKIERWLEEARYTASLPHHPERDRGNEAVKRLEESGFNVIVLTGAPWIQIERR